jgi:AcrR family transcriptional regulator
MGVPRPSRTNAASDETRTQIIDAAMETLRSEGIVGTTTRAIARTGGFNQSLIHYHFQSVWGALLAGCDRMSGERRERYVARLADVSSLPELVRIAADLHREDSQEGHITVLAQMLAGSAGDAELAKDVRERFDPWIDLVRDAVERVLSDTAYDGVVPPEDLGLAVTAMFLGIELLTHGSNDGARAESLFNTLIAIATIVDSMLLPAEAEKKAAKRSGTSGSPAPRSSRPRRSR